MIPLFFTRKCRVAHLVDRVSAGLFAMPAASGREEAKAAGLLIGSFGN